MANWSKFHPRGRRIVLCASNILFVTCLYTLTALGEDQRLQAVVDALQKRYGSVGTIHGRFRQNYRAPGIEQSEAGEFWMKKPGLMRWEYRAPEAKLFVADGRESYLYTPEERQVMVRRYSAAELHSTPLQFLLGQGEIAKSYTVSWETESGPKVQNTKVLRLVPRVQGTDYAYLLVEVDGLSSEIRRIVIRELTGNTSEFILTDLATNIRVDGKQFQFNVPRGVEVVRLDER